MHDILHEFDFNVTIEFGVIQALKNQCLHIFSDAIDLIIFNLASYKDMQKKILDKF